MVKRTKIVATIGPSSSSKKTIKHFIENGVNLFRFNFKHNNQQWHEHYIDLVYVISKRLGKNVGTIADLQGPSLRTGVLENDKPILLKKGDMVVLSKEKLNYTDIHIPFNQIDDIKSLKLGSSIFIADGVIELITTKFTKDYIKAKVEQGYTLGSRKSINISHGEFNLPSLTAKDKTDVKTAVKKNMEYAALSFVRDKKDVNALRKYIKSLDGKLGIISKIETGKAVENIDEIIEASDAIMVGRGDLGIEIAIERVPKIQKEIIKKCREKAVPVIVATQMLKSMVENPLPTRAEVADIANTVMLDRTDAIMLSEESATGKYPEKAVVTMAKIARYNEHDINEISQIDTTYNIKSFQDLIILSALRFSQVNIPKDHIKGYIVFTESGRSARTLSRYRCNTPIFAFTQNIESHKKLALSWGVESFFLKLSQNPVINIKQALYLLKRKRVVEADDKVVIIFGSNVGVEESNNTLSVLTI